MNTTGHTQDAPTGGYRAHGFPPDLKGRMVSGQVSISVHSVRFDSPEGSVSLPLAQVRVRRGGHNDETIFFEHPEFPGWSISSSDPELLKDPVLGDTPQFSRELRGADRSRKGIPAPVKIGLGLLALFFGALLLLILQKDRIVGWVVDRIPVTWEEQFGESVFANIKGEGKMVEDSPWNEQVKTITSRLLPAVENTGYNFKFHIMQDTNVNAFAIPGGNVVILTGLLDRAGTAEEVAGVLAHELAHVTERHSMKQIVQSAGLWVLVTALFGDSSGIAALLTESSRFLLQQKFSRNAEREADDLGWRYLLEAKIDPRGMTRFFEKMKEIYENSGMAAMESTFALLNTHPTSDERIERLQKKWEALENKAGFIELGPWKSPDA